MNYRTIMSGLLLGVAPLLSVFTSDYYAEETQMNANQTQVEYAFPSEEARHEGTWLTWPHEYTYGKEYAAEIEPIWVAMVKALAPGEKVHIIAYNEAYQARIIDLLNAAEVEMTQVDFVLAESDDYWTRDTGPMFVRDNNGTLKIVDFGFDGWGKKAPYTKDDAIPQVVAKERGYELVDASDFVLEGGSVELDGHGTAMLTRSAVISKNRNPEMSQAEAEHYLTQYLGATRFIWLEGVVDEDITDAHIDGFARFFDEQTIITVPEEDFFELYEGITEQDYETLMAAQTKDGAPYKIVEIPLTKENVTGLDYKGSYLNFYIGNDVVLVPVYGDSHDAMAVEQIAQLYPTKTIVPINVSALYQHGGMIHCITQQQPE